MPSDADVARALTIHRTLNFVVFGLVLAALGLRLFRRNDLQGWSRRGYLALVVVATGLVLLAADFGGKMVYGAHFLPF
jgi:sulfite exporter TauE/SafE